MSSKPPVVLIVGEYAWSNWTRYELEADFLSPTDGWSVEVSNATPAQLALLTTGSMVVILVDDQVALKGQLEEKRYRRTSTGLQVSLSGRDLAAPLVDCSPTTSWSFRDQSVASVAAKAIAELGLSLQLDAHTDAEMTRRVIKAEPGEKYWSVLERYCKKLRLLPWVSPDGVLHLGRPDYTGASLATLRNAVQDRTHNLTNILEYEYSDSITGRFTPLTVYGQGSDGASFGAPAQLKGSAEDADIKARGLYRPGVVDDGDLHSNAEATARARWEVSWRQFEGERLTVSLVGHGPKPGKVWTPNTQVTVDDELRGESSLWWLAGRRLVGDRSGGARAVLQLRRPNTLLPPVAS